jgi:hypothetical protein
MPVEPEYRSGATFIIEESDVLDHASESSVAWTDWSDRIESMIERYPWPTLLLAMGLGYLIARRVR